MNNCVYCDKLEDGNVESECGWFVANKDAHSVCPDCEKIHGLGETVVDEMYVAKQARSEAAKVLGKKSWQVRKGQNMSALAKKRWNKHKVE